MVAYSFQHMFVYPILVGIKDQTMRDQRRGRSRHSRAGERIQLYYAMRTRWCQFLGESHCLLVMPVELMMEDDRPLVIIDEMHELEGDEVEAFAKRDGFADWEALCRHWWDERQVRRWSGWLMRWDRSPIINRAWPR